MSAKSNLKIKNYIGPDGTNKTFYNISGTTIWTGHNDDQWIQYKAYLNISVNINYDYSPVLKEVTISYNCLPNTIGRTPANGSVLKINDPKFRWIFEEFDSKDQKAFQMIRFLKM